MALVEFSEIREKNAFFCFSSISEIAFINSYFFQIANFVQGRPDDFKPKCGKRVLGILFSEQTSYYQIPIKIINKNA